MSTWITNMTHFPKPQELSNRVPMAIIKTTLQFGSIVKMVAQHAATAIETVHGCGGKIQAALNGESDKIIWRCTNCEDSGEISSWRGSGWDIVSDKAMPRLVVGPKKKRTPKKSRRGTLVLNRKEFNALKKVISDGEFALVFAAAQKVGEQEFALSLTKRQLDSLYNLVGDLLDFGPSHQRKMWNETYDTIAWAMDEITFAEVEERQK